MEHGIGTEPSGGACRPSGDLQPQAKGLGHRFQALIAAAAEVEPASLRTPPHTPTRVPEPPWVFDAPMDRAYAAAEHPLFEHVLTVCTQEWVGIRAATGSLPGRKLAISKNAVWSELELRKICYAIEAAGVQIILVHGGCFPVFDFLVALRYVMPELTIVGVWHGTLAAWAFDEEHAIAARFLKLASNGVFDRICFLRRGLHVLHPKAVPYLIPNLPPQARIKRLIPPFRRRPIRCLFGGWNNQWKNMYANIVAAASSPSVGKVLTYAPAALPEPMGLKLELLTYRERRDHFVNLAGSDIALNVTTVDCHPMIELEALAVGTPVLRSELDLDFGEGHSFSKYFTVRTPHNPLMLRERLEEIASMPPKEITEIVADYRALVESTSYERYGAFLTGDS